MADQREQIRFMLLTADLGIIAATAEAGVNLEAVKTEFGLNFNTIMVLNNAAEEIIVKLDGRQVIHVKGNGTVFGLDWEDGIFFSDVRVINNDAVNATAANEIRISVGRTGA